MTCAYNGFLLRASRVTMAGDFRSAEIEGGRNIAIWSSGQGKEKNHRAQAAHVKALNCAYSASKGRWSR